MEEVDGNTDGLTDGCIYRWVVASQPRKSLVSE